MREKKFYHIILIYLLASGLVFPIISILIANYFNDNCIIILILASPLLIFGIGLIIYSVYSTNKEINDIISKL